MKTQTDTWTLEEAATELAEVVRRALEHQPQLLVRGTGGEEGAVVVLARSEYQRLIAPPPQNLYDFLRNSPLAEAVRDGLLDPDDLTRHRDSSPMRDVDLS
jgi:hypothetical protein